MMTSVLLSTLFALSEATNIPSRYPGSSSPARQECCYLGAHIFSPKANSILKVYSRIVASSKNKRGRQ